MSPRGWKAPTSARRRIVRFERSVWHTTEFYRLLTTDTLGERSYENPTENSFVLRGYCHRLRWPLPRPIGSATQREPGRQQKGKPRLRPVDACSKSNAQEVDSLLEASGHRGYAEPRAQHERLVAGREIHDREVQLRIDSGDLQPQCSWMSQALGVPTHGD